VATLPTRMELNFVAWPATAVTAVRNPLNPASPLIRSQPDFGGSYPVPVLRYAFPNIWDPSITVGTLTRGQALAAYARNLMRNVWTYGQAGNVSFQNQFFMSGFGIGPFGGTFNVTIFFNPGGRRYANDWDLAAVVQLGSAVGLGISGAELLDSIWVIQYPFGYIREGQLFGANQPLNCNNPYYRSQSMCNPLFSP
jgi:hypothetical protein